MRNIACRHIEELEKTPEQLAERRKQMLNTLKKYRHVILYGLISVILYTVLYEFSSNLTKMAQETHSGHKALFFVPIVIALVFSLVHGTFTSHFWDSLGVKAKSR